MKFDVTIFPDDLNGAGDLAKRVEDMGFDGLWTGETAHNPFLPLTHAAAQTSRIQPGTAIAVAFPRSPMVTAQIAWDLAQRSGGRFLLGPGTQIKPRIVKRFSATWDKPVSQLREYVESLRVIWQAFQSDEGRLRYEGLLDRVGYYFPFQPEDETRRIIREHASKAMAQARFSLFDSANRGMVLPASCPDRQTGVG